MSFLSDLFNGPSNAAQDQINAIVAGQQAATNQINQGNSALQTNYADALAPYTQNYGQAQQGVTALGNVLGLNGAAGSQNASAALQTMPGYQFALQQGNNATNAAAAANGTLNSGNQLLALSKQNQGLASQNYNNYVSQLQPYLSASNQAAGGIAGVDTGLGNSLNQNYNNLANIDNSADVGIGNAQASAALANQQNDFSLLKGIAGLGTNTLGGGLLSGIGSSLSLNNIGNALSTGGFSPFGSLISSDERLKEEIEPVGNLYDGTKVYRYFYKGDDVPRIGVMAQEVEKRYPDAVTEIGGYKAVDYGKATQYASEIAKLFSDDRRESKRSSDTDKFGGRYASDLSHFLKAA